MNKLFAILPVILLAGCGGGDSNPEIGRYNGRVTNVMENPNIKRIKSNVTGTEFQLETDNAQDIIARAAEIYAQLNPGENLYENLTSNSGSPSSNRVSMSNGLTKPDNNRTLEEKKLDKARTYLNAAKNYFSGAKEALPKTISETEYAKFLVMCGIDPETYEYNTVDSFIEYLKAHKTETTNRTGQKEVNYALPDEIANAVNNPNLWYTQRNIANMNMYTGGDLQIKGRIDVEKNAFIMGIFAPSGTEYEFDASESVVTAIDKDSSTTYENGKLTCVAANGCDWSKYLGFNETLSLSDMTNGITESKNLAFGNRNLGGKLKYSDFGYVISNKNDFSAPTFIGGYDIKRTGMTDNISNLADAAKITESTVYTGNAYAVIGGHSVRDGDATLTVNMANADNSLNMNFQDWYNITVNSDNTTTWAKNWSGDTAPSDAMATTDGITYDGRYEFYGATQSAPASEVVGTGSFVMPSDSNNPSVDISFGASNYPIETNK